MHGHVAENFDGTPVFCEGGRKRRKKKAVLLQNGQDNKDVDISKYGHTYMHFVAQNDGTIDTVV